MKKAIEFCSLTILVYVVVTCGLIHCISLLDPATVWFGCQLYTDMPWQCQR